MFEECVIRGRRFAPARFCAPMVGYTHSAFRRLLAELGGCGAVWTEMLAARQILSENFQDSPWLRRRPEEASVVFQLMVGHGDPLGRVFDCLGEHGVEAVDLNLACGSKYARANASGFALFEDATALRAVAGEARHLWPGLLTAKIRLGRQAPDWEIRLTERIRVLEDSGVDALTLHPRFIEERYRRRARSELIPWVASVTRLPLIANGDLDGPAQARERMGRLKPACAIMIGRMAIVRPWIFANWDHPHPIDHAALWRKLFHYIAEDFPPVTALRRVQMFTKYFAANFALGHQFRVAVSTAPTLAEALLRADGFFARSPALLAHASVAGL